MRRDLGQDPAVPPVLDDLAAEACGDGRQLPGLRLQLRETKPIRESGKQKHVRVPVELACRRPRGRTAPMDLAAVAQVRRHRNLDGTDERELDRLAAEQ